MEMYFEESFEKDLRLIDNKKRLKKVKLFLMKIEIVNFDFHGIIAV